jgi:ribosomal protein L12E/L44/L45/RPP1/RPP2
MRITEVADQDLQKLLALSQFLLGRADDTTAAKQISQEAFMDLAKSLGVNVTPENLNQLISRAPLKNILEPIEPGTGVVRFRGNVAGAGSMTVDKARQVVDQNAKAAMKRRM